MHLVRADGRVGVLTHWQVVVGSAVMYNLEVAHDHTFTVGAGRWVVHNCARSGSSGNSPSANLGNLFHYDELNGGPSGVKGGPWQLSQMYPHTDFRFTPRRVAGPDVEVVGGTHPSDPIVYPGTRWYPGSNYADFKPNMRQFLRDIRSGKLPPDTVPILYDPALFIITRVG